MLFLQIWEDCVNKGHPGQEHQSMQRWVTLYFTSSDFIRIDWTGSLKSDQSVHYGKWSCFYKSPPLLPFWIPNQSIPNGFYNGLKCHQTVWCQIKTDYFNLHESPTLLLHKIHVFALQLYASIWSGCVFLHTAIYRTAVLTSIMTISSFNLSKWCTAEYPHFFTPLWWWFQDCTLMILKVKLLKARCWHCCHWPNQNGEHHTTATMCFK